MLRSQVSHISRKPLYIANGQFINRVYVYKQLTQYQIFILPKIHPWRVLCRELSFHLRLKMESVFKIVKQLFRTQKQPVTQYIIKYEKYLRSTHEGVHFYQNGKQTVCSSTSSTSMLWIFSILNMAAEHGNLGVASK